MFDNSCCDTGPYKLFGMCDFKGTVINQENCLKNNKFMINTGGGSILQYHTHMPLSSGWVGLILGYFPLLALAKSALISTIFTSFRSILGEILTTRGCIGGLSSKNFPPF